MKKAKIGLFEYSTAIFAAALGLAVLLKSKEVSAGIARGLALCADVLIPALFPFMVFTCWLSLTGASRILSAPLGPITERLFRLPRELGAIVLLGFIGGYPTGAKSISLLYGQKRIDKPTAERMLCFCMSASPSFVLSAVGAGMLGEKKAGAALLAGQVCANVLMGIILSRKAAPPTKQPVSAGAANLSGSAAFVAAVSAAASAILNMCSYTVLFSGALALVLGAGGDKGILRAVIAAFFEVSSGCEAAVSLGGVAAIVMISICLSFRGLSIWFQTISFFQGADISFKPVLASRFLHAFISIIVTLTLTRLSSIVESEASREVFAPAYPPAFSADGRSLFLACCLLFMCAILTLDYSKIVNNKLFKRR